MTSSVLRRLIANRPVGRKTAIQLLVEASDRKVDSSFQFDALRRSLAASRQNGQVQPCPECLAGGDVAGAA
ncbi:MULTISPECIES: hypothetical protein [unclassified Bosea (in: a-proteobacteria)]|uniref:hypothetical protein n=1 Tax=unclassified Bosea (in: a-proteobacteria) TaxID=2653178 RepID=UPI000F7DB605|nr:MULTISPECIES: hypothetical protein [unclassified Bosea (in: a-proteobacteria)]